MPTRSEVIRARRKAVGGRRPRCRRGKSCSAACINQNKHCLVDAPTPVEGALPRAVKAIQTRREKLGRKEQKQILEKRREYVKGKVKGRRSEYLRVRGILQREIDEAVLMGNKNRFSDKMAKLQEMEDRVGSRLGIPKIKVEDYSTMRSRLQSKRERFEKIMYSILLPMEEASKKGKKGDYDKLEKKLLKIKEKAEGSLFWDYFFKYRDPVNKGSIWKRDVGDREKDRVRRLNEKLKSLRFNAERAAQDKNRSEYNRLEEAILKIQAKYSNRIGLYEHEKVKKGELWTSGRLASSAPQITVKYMKSMNQALEDGDSRKYDRLESTLLRVKEKLKERGILHFYPELNAIYRGSVIGEYVSKIKDQMSKSASEGDRRGYDKLEKRLFKLTSDNVSKRGEIWVKQRVQGVLGKLKDELEKAIRDNDRSKYNKLEGRLFRIRDKFGASVIQDPVMRTMGKGEMWRNAKGGKLDVKFKDLVPHLNAGKREGVEGISIDGGPSDFNIVSRVLGNKLVISILPNDSTSFTVNGSHLAKDNLSKREKIAIIREVKRQYNEIMRTMEDNTVFRVSAASGDEREDMRTKAYTDYGFSKPDHRGYMYGVVIDGKIEPINEDEYYNLQ